MKIILKYKYIFEILFIVSSLNLAGCNNNMVNYAGNSSNLGNNKYNPATPSSYQGSQAYNSSLYNGEEVNNQTGSLIISKKLIKISGITQDIDLNLNLIYSCLLVSSQILGLPKGWNYQLSYVIPSEAESIKNTSVNIDGSYYLFDKTWHDNKLYYSGLRYINNHGIKFEQVNGRSLPWKSDSRKYFYIYRDEEGGHQYFDFYGKLLARDNRFGIHISYIYADLVGNVYKTHLKEIDDSYGQQYFIIQNGNKATIVNNGKTLSTFTFDNTGVKTYADAMGYMTKFFYTHDNLINKISYPSGLVTTFEYTSLPYKLCNGADQYLFAVKDVTHYSTDNKILDHTIYNYGSDGGTGNTFTGYPNICMSEDSDHVSDSVYNGFKYDVETQRIDITSNQVSQRSRVYYNNLHLPIEEDILDKSGKPRFVKKYVYYIDANPSNRSSSFSRPVTVTIFNEDRKVAIESTTYNDYEEPILNQVSGIINNKWLTFRKAISSYFELESAFYLAKETVDTDMITGTVIYTKNSLTKNHNNIATSIVQYTNPSPEYTGVDNKKYTYDYDSSGRVISEFIEFLGIPPPGSPKNTKITHNYTYSNNILTDKQADAFNHITTIIYNISLPGSPVLSITSPLGKTITSSYDEDGRETSVTSPMGYSTTTKYHIWQQDNNNQAITTDPLGHVVTIQYDELARLGLVTDNGGINRNTRMIKQNQYNQLGELTNTTDILGKTTTYQYDEFGRIISSRDFLNNTVTVSYDDVNLTTISYLNGVIAGKEIKDSLGNNIKVLKYSMPDRNEQPNILEQDNTYNAFGLQLKSTMLMNNRPIDSKSTIYNSCGEAEKTNDYTYDNMLIEQSSNKDLLCNTLNINTTINKESTSNSYTNTFDALGQLTTSQNNLGIKNVNYDMDGNLKNILSYEGLTKYAYDDDNNVISQIINGITLNKSYDANGNVINIADLSKGGSTIKYSYTNTNLLETITYPDGKTISYAYYDNGLLKTKTNAFGVVTTYSYDNNGRITNIATLDSNLSYTYDDNVLNAGRYGMLKTLTLTNKNGQLLTHTYNYDSWGNMAKDQIITQGINQTLLTYDRDWLQRLSKQTITSSIASSSLNLTKTFEYDGLNRLLSSKAVYKGFPDLKFSEAYKYDQAGNITEYINNESITHYKYKNDQLIAVNGTSISYDKAGNMLNDLNGNTYTYNNLNQLVGVSKNDNLITSYSYYVDGLLSSKNTTTDNLTFYYDNGYVDGINSSNLFLGLDSTSFMLLIDGSPIAVYKNKAADYYLSAANSTISMFSESGSLINSYKYASYGTFNADKTTNDTQNFLWNEEYNDNDTGLVYLRSRFYNPKLMRFMTPDKYSVPNLYSYANGDPINNTDPSGHFPHIPPVPPLEKYIIGIFLDLVGILGSGILVSTLVALANVVIHFTPEEEMVRREASLLASTSLTRAMLARTPRVENPFTPVARRSPTSATEASPVGGTRNMRARAIHFKHMAKKHRMVTKSDIFGGLTGITGVGLNIVNVIGLTDKNHTLNSQTLFFFQDMALVFSVATAVTTIRTFRFKHASDVGTQTSFVNSSDSATQPPAFFSISSSSFFSINSAIEDLSLE